MNVNLPNKALKKITLRGFHSQHNQFFPFFTAASPPVLSTSFLSFCGDKDQTCVLKMLGHLNPIFINISITITITITINPNIPIPITINTNTNINITVNKANSVQQDN